MLTVSPTPIRARKERVSVATCSVRDRELTLSSRRPRNITTTHTAASLVSRSATMLPLRPKQPQPAVAQPLTEQILGIGQTMDDPRATDLKFLLEDAKLLHQKLMALSVEGVNLKKVGLFSSDIIEAIEVSKKKPNPKRSVGSTHSLSPTSSLKLSQSSMTLHSSSLPRGFLSADSSKKTKSLKRSIFAAFGRSKSQKNTSTSKKNNLPRHSIATISSHQRPVQLLATSRSQSSSPVQKAKTFPRSSSLDFLGQDSDSSDSTLSMGGEGIRSAQSFTALDQDQVVGPRQVPYPLHPAPKSGAWVASQSVPTSPVNTKRVFKQTKEMSNGSLSSLQSSFKAGKDVNRASSSSDLVTSSVSRKSPIVTNGFTPQNISNTGSKSSPTGSKSSPTGPKSPPTGSKSSPTGSKSSGSKSPPTGSKSSPTGSKSSPTGSKSPPTAPKPIHNSVTKMPRPILIQVKSPSLETGSNMATARNSSKSSSRGSISDDADPRTSRPSITTLVNELTEVQEQVGGGVEEDTFDTLTDPQSGGDPRRLNVTASSATLELDELMQNLESFKPPAAPSNQAETQHKPQSAMDDLSNLLGNLETDMVNIHGVRTEAKGVCAACKKPILAKVLDALGRQWHPEHFTCAACDVELGNATYYESNGRPYCEKDYHELYAPRCAYCNGPILERVMRALDKTWHPEHFFCTLCGKKFGADGFHEKDSKAFCRECYYDNYAPRCKRCDKAIMEGFITALNAQWHPECFSCKVCNVTFPRGNYFEHEGEPHCELHYHASRGTLCASCQKPVTGKCVTAMGRKWHPEHFTCAFCLKLLNKGTFKEHRHNPYCQPCFIKLFG